MLLNTGGKTPKLPPNIKYLDILNNEVRANSTLFCRHQILQAEYCNADCTTWKLTLKDINTTPKELKTERDCSHRQLFRPLWGSSVWRNNQKKLWWKISEHSDLSCDLELSTTTESRHTTCLLGAAVQVSSWCLAEKIKGRPKSTSKTWTEPCKNYSISDI